MFCECHALCSICSRSRYHDAPDGLCGPCRKAVHDAREVGLEAALRDNHGGHDVVRVPDRDGIPCATCKTCGLDITYVAVARPEPASARTEIGTFLAHTPPLVKRRFPGDVVRKLLLG